MNNELLDKEDQLWFELKQWADKHGFGKICVEFTIHQKKIVGMEEVPERTKRILKV